MDDSSLLHDDKRIKELLREYPDEVQAETPHQVLLDEIVQAAREQLEDETEVRPMEEGLLEPEYVVRVIQVVMEVDLQQISALSCLCDELWTSLLRMLTCWSMRASFCPCSRYAG